MTDSRTVTGGNEDLTVDAPRCLRMRYSESGCRLCVDICRHGAVKLDGGLTINPQLCSGCLLCTSVCPAGALEQRSDFAICLAQLSRVQEPVLGCVRTKEYSNGILTCLGGLSAEHLLALCHTVPGKLTLNLSACADCPNSAMTAQLRQRLDNLSTAGLTADGCRLVSAESAQDCRYCGESIDRRSFFKSFRNSLIKSADIILSTPGEKTERQSKYAVKRLPLRRELLNRVRNKLSIELAGRLHNQFDSCLTFADCCTKCHGCVAICPTGAIYANDSESPPAFDQLLCTGCGLCHEFCLEGAVRILPANKGHV